MHRMKMPKRRAKPGAMPGTIIPNPESPLPVIKVIAYDNDRIEEVVLDSPHDLKKYIGHWHTVWIDVDGLGHAELLAQLGKELDIHRLALEDIVNTHQRPKTESYDGRLFVVVRMVAAVCGTTEQASFFYGPGFVVSFNEHHVDCFDAVRRRIREHLGKIRALSPDYLLYSLIDATVDSYFPRLEEIGERLEDLESTVLRDTDPRILNKIQNMRQELLAIRRIMGATREAVNALIRDTADEFQDSTRLYLRDLYDHTIQIIDIVESQREIASGLIEIHLSTVSNRMNQIMKVLTVISSVFIPLTFIVGVYGMNFDTEVSPLNMPELEWYFGYPAVMLLMIIITVVELWLFWRKGWLWDRRRKGREEEA